MIALAWCQRLSRDGGARLPSVTANYRVARDSVRARVKALVDSLARAERRR